MSDTPTVISKLLGIAKIAKIAQDLWPPRFPKKSVDVEQLKKLDFPDETFEYFAGKLELAKHEVVIALFGSPIYDATKEERESRKKFYSALNTVASRGVTVKRIYLIRNQEDFDSISRLVESSTNRSNSFFKLGCYVGNIQGESETPWLDLMLIDSKEVFMAHSTRKNQSDQETLASTNISLITLIKEHLKYLWRSSYEINNQKELDDENLREVQLCLNRYLKINESQINRSDEDVTEKIKNQYDSDEEGTKS
jgi:hypothetical protein